MASLKRTIHQQVVTIEVNEQDGSFSWSPNGDGTGWLTDTSLPKLVARIGVALAKKRVSVSVPVGILEYRQPVNVKLTRFSERDHTHVLVKTIDGAKHDPIRRYEAAYQVWDDASAAEYKRLQQACVEADRALEAYLKTRVWDPKRRINVEDLLSKALDEKAAEQEAKAEPVAVAEGEA